MMIWRVLIAATGGYFLEIEEPKNRATIAAALTISATMLGPARVLTAGGILFNVANWVRIAPRGGAGLGLGSLTVGYVGGALAGTAIVGVMESQGLVPKGSTDDVAELYIGVAKLEPDALLEAAAIPVRFAHELYKQGNENRAVPNNAAGIPAGTNMRNYGRTAAQDQYREEFAEFAATKYGPNPLGITNYRS